MTLPPGFHDVPPGHVPAIVTDLEMRAPAAPRPVPDRPDLALVPLPRPGLDLYRGLIRLVGTDWLWQAALAMPDEDLRAALDDPRVEVSVLRAGDRDAGILQLDLREPGACEITFFGVARADQGTGAARWLMNRALAAAWRAGVGRVWLHTCTLDHPAAPAFYRRTGFEPVRQYVEILPDPRLRGLLPRDAAPHVPLAAEEG